MPPSSSGKACFVKPDSRESTSALAPCTDTEVRPVNNSLKQIKRFAALGGKCCSSGRHQTAIWQPRVTLGEPRLVFTSTARVSKMVYVSNYCEVPYVARESWCSRPIPNLTRTHTRAQKDSGALETPVLHCTGTGGRSCSGSHRDVIESAAKQLVWEIWI